MNAKPTPVAERPLPDGADIRLPWHLGLPASLEEGFRTYLLGQSRRVIRTTFFIVVALLAAGSLVEALVDPASAMQSWRARLLAIMAAALVWRVAASERPLSQLQPAVSFCALVIAASNNYLASSLEHALSYSYYLFNLLAIMLMGTLFRITVRWAAITSFIILFTMLISMVLFSNLDHSAILSLFFFILCGGALSLYGQYSFEKLQRQHYLSERVLAMHRSELHSANQVLENQVTEDPLTGAVNRRGMEERLSRLIHQQKQRGPQEGNLFAILFDIDFFKQYNDTYGHLAGDNCLRTVADAVHSMIQSEADFVARYGGEEFLVILNGIHLNDALVFAERMRDRIEKQGMEHRSSRCSNVITISVGVASWRSDILHTSELIHLADEALYEAKRLGRNRVVMIDDNNSLKPL